MSKNTRRLEDVQYIIVSTPKDKKVVQTFFNNARGKHTDIIKIKFSRTDLSQEAQLVTFSVTGYKMSIAKRVIDKLINRLYNSSEKEFHTVMALMTDGSVQLFNNLLNKKDRDRLSNFQEGL